MTGKSRAEQINEQLALLEVGRPSWSEILGPRPKHGWSVTQADHDAFLAWLEPRLRDVAERHQRPIVPTLSQVAALQYDLQMVLDEYQEGHLGLFGWRRILARVERFTNFQPRVTFRLEEVA